MGLGSITADNILLVGSILLFASILVGRAGSKFGVPVLLLFLGVGMLFGIDGFGIDFNNAHAAQFIGSVALSIILFSGGMDTKIVEIRPVMAQGVILATLGVMMTAFITGLIIFYSSKLTPYTSLTIPESMLLAATMSSTDSASVFSILRSKGLSLKHNLRPLLELESGSNDPMAFMLTIIFIKMITIGKVSISFFLS